MILGTHNTMTYRTPKQWYLYPVKFISQCQSVDYKTQHEKYGANSFDLRLFWNKKGVIEFRHGAISYDASDLNEILEYCQENNIICRIFFEERKFPKSLAIRSEKMGLKEKFIETCKWIEETYPNLICVGGRNCGTWEKLYDFKNDNYIEEGYYSSVTSLFENKSAFLRIIDDWCPWYYARTRNKENKVVAQETFGESDNTIVRFDFINIG